MRGPCRKAIIVLALLIAATSALACGGGGGEATPEDIGAIEALVREQSAATDARDFDTIYNNATEDSLAESFPNAERSYDGFKAAAETFWAEREGVTQPIIEVYDVDTDSDDGTVTVSTTLKYDGADPTSTMISAGRWRVRKIDGEWKVDQGFEWTSPRIPDGTPVVDLSAKDFSWEFDAAQLTSGNFALRMKNDGEQQHMLDILKIPADLDVAAWLAGAMEPSGEITDLTGSVPLQPGDARDFTFTAPLASGRYLMMCYILDEADHAFHSEKGMVAEFTVQ